MSCDSKMLRESLGLSQAMLAQLLGVHPMTVSRWERGVLNPDPYRAILLEAASVSIRYDPSLGVKLQTLLNYGHVATALFLLLKPSQS